MALTSTGQYVADALDEKMALVGR
jgi:hypothetical protein